ncbi:MAG: glycosyltransferase family 39 protein [bacterium]|nr:glycosyltransferase family 39 protein [bacterium]
MRLTSKVGLRNLIIILLLGAGLRLYHLGYEDLWVDEIYTIQTASLPWSASSLSNLHPRDFLHFVFDFVIMRFWLKLGTDPGTVRLLSALAGIATIGLLFVIGRKLFNDTIGLLSALFLALSSYHIYYSQEACAYALQVFLILAMVYYFIRGFEENKVYLWIIFTILTVLGIAVREFTMLTWVALMGYAGISIFFWQRKPNRIELWFGSQLLIILFCSFGLCLFLNQAGAVFYGEWISKPTFEDIGETFNYFSLGWLQWDMPNLVRKTIVPIFIFLFLYSRFNFNNSEPKKLPLDHNPGLMLCWYLFIIPLILFYLVSFKKPIFIPYRYVIIILPFFYLLIAYSLSKIPKKFIRYSLLAIVVFGMIFGTIAYHQATKKIPWSKISAEIDRNALPTDIVLIYEEYWKHGLLYYQRSSIPVYPIYLWKNLSEHFQDLTKGHSRIWLITVAFGEKETVDEIYTELNTLYSNQLPILSLRVKQPGGATVKLTQFSNDIK